MTERDEDPPSRRGMVLRRRRVTEHRCPRCGKIEPITVPPYQRKNWEADLCHCPENAIYFKPRPRRREKE